ncbi:MAG: hypothetical protein F2840_00120 [Actinobacteria bacterium]|uniref:Unannotated protein n=1 Tax=freshwater metagenome TaxID=449393 RepID=A0A6J7I928_9ZZZZ|nr:hypothetical protein [Actinomycetota bacterium]
MSEWRISEAQLHLVNTALAEHDDTIVPNLLTRTAQESKLFPMLPYFMMSFMQAYYMYPGILRKASEHISPEDVGHRMRNSSIQLGTLAANMGGQLLYLQGRVELIKLGVLRPEDNLEDLWYVIDWHERVMSTYRRNEGHIWTNAAGDMSQVLDERVLQVLEADAYEVDDELRAAVARFSAVTSQYSFLVYCESRVGMDANGPYNLGDQRMLHVRNFLTLGESGLPWMDGVAADIPYQNLTLSLITDDVRIEVTDFGSAYTVPETYQQHVIGVGLYTSDIFTDRLIPVGMSSKAELIRTLNEIADVVKAAITPLHRRFAAMNFDEMTEAGILAYVYALSDVSFMSGTWDQAEWEGIDDRVRRLWPVFNEEYGTASFMSDYVAFDGLHGAAGEYYIHPYSYRSWKAGANMSLPKAGRVAQLVPAYVLNDHDYTRRASDGESSSRSELPRKSSTYQFLDGGLTEDELNAKARSYTSPLLAAPWRNFDDASVKYGYQDPDVDAMYRYTQEYSRLLKGRGSVIVRADIDRIRKEAGESTWAEAAARRRAGH